MDSFGGAAKGLAAVFSSLIRAISTGEREQVRTIKSIADKKFSELNVTHKEFKALMKQLRAAAARAGKSARTPKAAISILEKEIATVQTARDEQRPERLAAFEEAKVYSSRLLQERGVLKRIPGDVALDLHLFMGAYVDYFYGELKYHHDLKASLVSAEASLKYLSERIARMQGKRKQALSATRRDVQEELRDLANRIEDWETISDLKWTRFSEGYYRLQRTLLENGFWSNKTQRIPAGRSR